MKCVFPISLPRAFQIGAESLGGDRREQPYCVIDLNLDRYIGPSCIPRPAVQRDDLECIKRSLELRRSRLCGIRGRPEGEAQCGEHDGNA